MSYAIVDDSGTVYAHDIQKRSKADVLCAEYVDLYPDASGIEVIASKE